MCSVDGFTGSAPFSIEEYAEFNKDRGPDGTSYYKDDQIQIAHSLLSIQPNSTEQPIVSERTGNVLSYNGEIYDVFRNDAKYLFDILESKDLDILRYDTNGMWAFAYYNRSQQRLYLGRDHFGVKPLFYVSLNNQLYFSSTMKPLFAVLNELGYGVEKDDVQEDRWQMSSRFMAGSYTPFKYIRKVCPGEIKVWDMKLGRFLRSDTMWGPKWNLKPNYKWTPEELKQIAYESISRVCQSDKKTTLSLSGGLDSSLIAGIGHEVLDSVTSTQFIRTKNKETDNEPMFGEYQIAKRTAEHWDIPIETNQYRYGYKPDQLYFSQWDMNRIAPRYTNIKTAAENGCKVYLVGDGADEMITGYNGDHGIEFDSMSRYVRDGTYPDDKKHQDINMMVNTDLFREDLVNNFLFERTMRHGDGFNMTTDYLCGLHGIESRAPFFYQKFAKYLLTIPSGFKWHTPNKDINFGTYKWVFRECLSEYYTDEVKDRVKKTGFAAPWDSRQEKLNRQMANEEFNQLLIDANELSFN